jgi:uncharacterized protein (DUF1015 family)
MPQIEAFRGIRYDMGHVGALSDVVAPPYDVIDDTQQSDLYRRHPANVIRLILNRDEPGDDEETSRYARAARFLKTWQREGVLCRDQEPALYVYHQLFQYQGREYTRRGFMARLRLEPFGEGNVFPHEETHSAAKADRLRLTNACKANLSPIFGIYPDPDNEAQETLEDKVRGTTPIEATDHLGVVHRLWSLTDLMAACDLNAIMGDKPLYIADGHHRYETACNYRDQLAAGQPLETTHPANYVLAMCVGMSDLGMIVLPTHRLFRGVPDWTAEDLQSRLGTSFQLSPAGTGAAAAANCWETVDSAAQQGCMGFYTRADDRWSLATVTDEGRTTMAQIASQQSEDWRSLGVSLLHRLALDHLMKVIDLPTPTYVHLLDEVISGIRTEGYPLAALVMPATLDHIRRVSQHGERMPAKSTYFYPKLLSGLVINPLD